MISLAEKKTRWGLSVWQMWDNDSSLKQNCPLQTATPVEDALTEDLDETRMTANLSIFAIWMAPHCSKRAETRYWKKKKSNEFAIHNMVLATFLF